MAPTGAYGGSPAVIPGTIEAEEYDYGGEGVAYYDTDPGNNGGVSSSSGGRGGVGGVGGHGGIHRCDREDGS